MARRELGEILREADLVSDSQIAEALALQRTFGERLASILVRQRILTEKFAVTYLGRQLGVAGVDLSRTEIDASLLEIVPLELCERHLVFPIRVEGPHLQLAMSDPTDDVLVAELERKTGVRLAPLIALESSLKATIAEARRAIKAGQQVIAPNALRPREAESFPKPPVVEGALPPESPLPVRSVEAQEPAVFETLAGAPLGAPTRPSAPPPSPVSVPMPEPQASEPTHTVLVVDDDEAIQKLLKVLLESRRYRVITAGTGRQALAKVRESIPDLVILDGMIPEIHGFDICRQLKTSERFRHIPIVMVSAVHRGWRFAADVKEKYGADDYVEKPFEAADLLKRVEGLLSQSPPAPPESEAAARLHLKEGVVALKQEKLNEAVAALGRGLALDAANDMLHYYLAMAYEKKDMVFHAIDHYERAIALNPDFYDAITALAQLYQAQQFRRKAAEMWELALSATQDEAVRARIKEHLLTLL